MFCEPPGGWQQATAREHRTKLVWAQEVASLLHGRYADCERMTLVCDKLNTQTIGAFCEAFEPDRAGPYVRQIDFCCTPKHWEQQKMRSLVAKVVRTLDCGFTGRNSTRVSLRDFLKRSSCETRNEFRDSSDDNVGHHSMVWATDRCTEA